MTTCNSTTSSATAHTILSCKWQKRTNFGGVDSDEDRRAVRLLSLDALDVHDELLAVDLHDLADLLSLVVTTYNLQIKYHTSSR